MEHGASLIATVAAAFGVALVLGVLAERIKVPALVGYLLAGIVIGPATPGFVADIRIASQLSEIGIMLLMFGVGLHFSPNDLMAVRRIAAPGAIGQMGCVTVLGTVLGWSWGWSFGSALVFGLSMSCASTVVLLKSLEARGRLDSINGRIAVGWLVIQDFAAVLVLILLPALAGVLRGQEDAVVDAETLWLNIGHTLLQVTGFIALMMVVGRRVLPWVLWHVARTGSRELFTLSVVATAIGIAFGASLVFNISFALGAFIAGSVMRESEFSHRAAEETLPLRDAFSVLFFVSVGMLIQPMILIDKPLHTVGVIAIVILGNSLGALLVITALRYPLGTAIEIAVGLGQIGEFSIILAGLGVKLGLLPVEGMQLVLAGVLISITLNSFLFRAVEPILNWAIQHSQLARRLAQRQDPYAALPMSTDRKYLEGQVVLVGFGRVGRRISEVLEKNAIPFVVVEQNRELVENLRKRGQAAVSGNAADPTTLIQAHIARAAMLVVATPDTMSFPLLVETSRTLNPDIEIVLRTHSEEESDWLREEGLGLVFFGEEELAKGMVRHVLTRFAPQGETH